MRQRRDFVHGNLTFLRCAPRYRNDPNPTRRGIPRNEDAPTTHGVSFSVQTLRADAAQLTLRPRSSDRGET